MTDYERDWVTITGTGGSWSGPLEDLSKRTLIKMLKGEVKWTMGAASWTEI